MKVVKGVQIVKNVDSYKIGVFVNMYGHNMAIVVCQKGVTA